VKWLVGANGYLVSFNALYLVVAALAWWVATPSTATTSTLSAGWIVALLLRNAAVLVAWFGLFHFRLYVRKSQGARFKFNHRWPAERSERFSFGSQLKDNVFWTMASGLPIWTAFEVFTLWLFANAHIPTLSPREHPVWFGLLLFLTPVYRELHFYATHRLIHVPLLYKTVHSLHHRNTNPGPWSGLSMHPAEHLLYFSAVALHWVIPSHPLHAMYTLFHLAMAPAPGHAGFERIELGSGSALSVPTNGYSHYLHHKLFEVNYADGIFPLDRWFGSFHDGTPEADARMKQRRRLQRHSR
jgi:sterol desaturase/sphingolipid hydroxylase (fatty acid hydroxylase superfamily)